MNLNKKDIRNKIKRLNDQGKELPNRLRNRAEQAGVDVGSPEGLREMSTGRKEHASSSPIKGYNIENTKGLINAQNEANMDAEQRQGEWNRVNEYDPYGSSTFSQNPDGTWSRTVKLNDAQQGKLDQRNAFDSTLGRLGNQFAQNASGQLSQPFRYDGTQMRSDMQNKLMDFYESRNQPVFQQQQEQLEQRLASMGIPRGSEQWNKEMTQMGQMQTDSRMAAMTGALQNAGQEQMNQFNMAASAHQMPLSQLGMMSGLMQGPTGPAYSGISQIGVNPLNVAGIQQGNRGLDLTQRGQDLQHSASMAAINKPHAGMGYDPFALATHKANLDRENALFQSQVQGGGARTPNMGTAVGNGVAGGIAAGASSQF